MEANDFSSWFLLSHSARKLDFRRSSEASLLERFGDKDRLNNLPRFDKLDGAHAPSWPNNISIWKLDSREETVIFHSLIERNYTVNSALIDVKRKRLVICAHDALEICDLNGNIEKKYSHPWFAGGHTVVQNRRGNYLVSCSSSDATLEFCAKNGSLIEASRIPCKIYGENYQLSSTSDVRKHYIPNDLQVSHLNSAYDCGRTTILSCFIQGAILEIGSNGEPCVIAENFIGCHGARRSYDGKIYFSHSPSGKLIWINRLGNIFEFDLSTTWLHDSLEIKPGLFVCAIGDRNKIALVDTKKKLTLKEIDLSSYGSTPCLFGEVFEN